MSLDGSCLEALFTNTYSVENPLSVTFFKLNISPCTNPVTFSTDIVVSLAGWSPAVLPPPASAVGNEEPVNVVEFATYNCPPTAFTDSFSNTAVAIVPRILAFSTSKNPPSAAVNLNPLPATSLANPLDSIVPSLRIIIWPPLNLSWVIVQPAISFPSCPNFTRVSAEPVPVPS